MTIASSSLARAVAAANRAMVDLEQQLNEADAKLGDGDTGGMLARVLSRMADVDTDNAPDIGAALTHLAKAATMATGSSLGTLFATGLLAIGRQLRGRASIDVSELSPLIELARDAMMARGGAALGDKTVLDSLSAITVALRDANVADDAAKLASDAAERALIEFRQKPNRIGRARMFGDQTIGIDDPGMLAIAELTKALA